MKEQFLDDIFDVLQDQAVNLFIKSGFVAPAIYGFRDNPASSLAISITEGPESKLAPRPDGTAVLFLPPPFHSHQDLIARIFKEAEVLAAAFLTEVWVYPKSKPDAAEEYLAGKGPSPSEHPDRESGLLSAVFAPILGYTRVSLTRIINDNGSQSIGGTEEVSESGEKENQLSFVASWLEECLPARG